MASGDSLLTFDASAFRPVAANFGTQDTRNNHLVLDLDADTDEEFFIETKMPQNYGGGGVDIIIHTTASSATSGDAIIDTDFENVASQDIDSDGFTGSPQSGTATANATSGVETRTTISHTDGAQMDSVTAGDRFRLRVLRDADNGSDNMAGDLEPAIIEIRES